MLSKEEKEIFETFIATEPDFAGEPVSWSGDIDPPDVLCETNKGRKIGVELGEWLHEAQTERARALEILEKEIASQIVKQNLTGWLGQYGVLLRAKPNVFLSKAKRPEFIAELFNMLNRFKISGQAITARLNDSSQAPTSGKFLERITIYPVRRMRGIKFTKDGWYSPKDARDALAEVLAKKTAKRNYQTLKKNQTVDELYLLVYYNRALLWNTPYEGIDGSIEVVVEQAREQVSLNHGPFDKILLFLAFEPGMKVFTLWP